MLHLDDDVLFLRVGAALLPTIALSSIKSIALCILTSIIHLLCLRCIGLHVEPSQLSHYGLSLATRITTDHNNQYLLERIHLHLQFINNSNNMDALAGYGSSSDSSDNAVDDKPPKSALSGLLGNLSDASDDDDDVLHEAADASSANKELDEEESHEPPKKKIRREEDAGEKSQPHQVLPQPQLLATDDANTTSDPFQSLILSTKDYTTQLRQALSQQIQSQTNEISDKQKRLADKLKLLQNTFQNKPSQLNDTRQPNSLDSNASSSTTISTSFASHLKSKYEFGNPHLLKDIIAHFQINSYDSKQQFKPFEYYVSEEKARIAAANYDAGSTL